MYTYYNNNVTQQCKWVTRAMKQRVQRVYRKKAPRIIVSQLIDHAIVQ